MENETDEEEKDVGKISRCGWAMVRWQQHDKTIFRLLFGRSRKRSLVGVDGGDGLIYV